jgi:hypothetical protein
MKVLLGFAAQFCGTCEEVVNCVEQATDEEIKALFPAIIGLPFDDNCYFIKNYKEKEDKYETN